MIYRIALTDGTTTTVVAYDVPADSVEEYRAVAREIIAQVPGDGRWVTVS